MNKDVLIEQCFGMSVYLAFCFDGIFFHVALFLIKFLLLAIRKLPHPMMEIYNGTHHTPKILE